MFLAFSWPPLLREIVLGYLSVAIVTWAAMIVTRVLLVPPSLGVPQAAEIRVFPMSDARAQHWHRWIAINVFWLVFVVVTFALMGTFGFDTTGRFRAVDPDQLRPACADPAGGVAAAQNPIVEDQRIGKIGATGWSWLLSLYFTIVWVIQIAGAWTLYWFVIAAVALPAVIVMAHRGVHLRAEAAGAGDRRQGRSRRSWSPSSTAASAWC